MYTREIVGIAMATSHGASLVIQALCHAMMPVPLLKECPKNGGHPIYAKQIGFEEFRKINENFEYRIIFNASLQREQVKFFEEIEAL